LTRLSKRSYGRIFWKRNLSVESDPIHADLLRRRQALLNEFATGTSNLILVYAHFDGVTLHVPDAAGRPGVGITLDDIKALADRPDARDRVIVLVACSTGKAAAGDCSLVSLLLKRRLARVAFPVWVYAIGGPFELSFSGYKQERWIGAIIIMFGTFLAGLYQPQVSTAKAPELPLMAQ
jgi:hypothetical protein